MADDQVKYSDLFESGIDAQVKALTEEIKSLRDAISAAKDEAQGMKKELSGMGTATREQQQAVSTQAAAIEKLQKQAKDLTEQEAKAVKFLADSLNFMNQNGTKNMNVWKNMTQSMDGFNMSYNQMKETVKVLESALKSLNSEQQRNSEGAKSAAAAVTRLKEAMQAFDAQTKTAKGNVEKTSRAYAKLTDEEIQSLNQLKTALQGTAQEQMAAVQAIDIQAKSYNELYQTYNAIKDVLNAMTVAERENTEEGKMMVNRAKEIRDTLNNLQQQTGNYTLNVGNYMSAMNGLQLQTQQLLREIPSAQNLTQFFLAISNNIPMFADAMSRYNRELPKMKANLAAVTAEITRQEAAMAAMNAQSTEYAAAQARLNELQRQQKELQGASVGGWRAVLKSVGSWQTFLIAGLLILRKIPDWVKVIRERWRETHETIKNVVSAQTALGQLHADVAKKVDDEAAELRLVVDRLQQVNKGTDEWVNGIATVNKITGENLDATTATIEMVDEVTKAYIRQAEQLATNAILTDRIAQSNANQLQRQAAMAATTFEGLDQIMGGTTGNDRMKLQAAFNKRQRALRDLQRKQSGQTVTRQVYETTRTGAIYTNDVEIDESAIKRELDNATRTLENIINKKFEVLSKEAIDALEAEYDLSSPMLKKKTPKTPRTKTEKDPRVSGSFNNSFNGPTQADVLVAEAKAMKDKGDDALAEIQMWYDKKVAIADASYAKELENLQKGRADKNKSLTENVNEAKIFVAKYNDILDQLDKDHAAGNLNDDEWQAQKDKLKDQYDEANDIIKSESVERQRIKDYYDNMEKVAEEAHLNEMLDLRKQYGDKLFKEEQKRFKAHQDTEKRRFELDKHNSIERAKFDMEQEIASKQWQIEHAKELELSEAELAILKEEVEWLEKKYSQGKYNAKRGNTGNYSNIMDVLFGENITSDQISALNSVFDQAKSALSSWVDARKEAADQAKELADDEVSAAENALNREIELRNQGYANNVALRERELADAKKRQEEAAKLQQKAKKEELAANTVMEASSMAVAVANLFKQFPLYVAIPLTGVLLGAWGAAKMSALNSIKSTKYREGGVMLLEGGSHQSGHDVNLGIGPDGSNLRAEGGEYFAVINKRNSRRYGSEIPNIVNALNSGMFEDRYIKTSDAMGMLPRIIKADDGSTVDLSAVESGVGALVKQGERTWSMEGDFRVERYKNRVRRVRVS